jgi:hypothetical protein
MPSGDYLGLLSSANLGQLSGEYIGKLSNLGSEAPAIILALLALGLVAHLVYVNRIYSKVANLSEGQVPRDKLFSGLSIPQGPTFDSMAESSWMLLFVAMAYYLFLTPSIFKSVNYFQIPELASSSWGFFIFGLGAMVLGFLVSNPIREAYGIYEISGRMKKGIMLAYLPLAISVLSSAYVGTAYPDLSTNLSQLAEGVALVALVVSLVLLLSPFYVGALKVIR